MAGAVAGDPGSATGLIELFRELIRRLLEKSQASGISPRALADQVADRNYPELVRHAYDREPLTTKIHNRLKASSLLPRFIQENEMKERGDRTIHYLRSLFL